MPYIMRAKGSGPPWTRVGPAGERALEALLFGHTKEAVIVTAEGVLEIRWIVEEGAARLDRILELHHIVEHWRYWKDRNARIAGWLVAELCSPSKECPACGMLWYEGCGH